jgi:protein TonB
MNRLQKKCVIASVGAHLLLLTILIVGPAFYNPQPKPDNTQVLDIIPANLIDAAFNSGVKNATPPAPAPVVTPPPPVPATPAPPVQNPPPPVPKQVEPKPTLPEKLKNLFTPEPKPEPVKPAPTETKSEHKIQPNLTPVVRTASKNPTTNPKPDNSRAIASAIRNLKRNLSPGMVVDVPGNSSAAYASYKDALATIYYNAWVTPNNAANDEADAIVKITVAADGTVLTSRIVTPSGDEKVDDSVRRALNRVSSVPPLPDQSKVEQEFTIDFNLKTKQMLE